MTTATLIPLRSARDQLIELLGLGEPYPLQDVPLRNESLMVALNIPAQIEIATSQPDVLYQLYFEDALIGRGQNSGVWLKRDPAGAWLQRTPERTWRPRTAQEEKDDPGRAIEAPGNGDLLTLETYPIQEDITFAIQATKRTTGRTTQLHAAVTVKVGLNLKLVAYIREAAPLDPAHSAPTAARIIDYGQSVTVAVDNSQEGVDYRLVTLLDGQETTVSTADVRGDLHTISLHSQSFTEDVDLRIRATKTFTASERRDPQSDLLEVVLPLKVRANPALTVTADTIIDYAGQARLTLHATQTSARYQLFRHALADREYVRQPLPAGEVITVAVPAADPLQVRQPARGEPGTLPTGYSPVGEPQPGTGGDLTFLLPALTEDSLLLIQASKEHQANPVVPSTVQLAPTALILVRPNPAPALRLQVPLAEPGTEGEITFFDGQPGVFYQLERSPDGEKSGLPAYFHQRLAEDPTFNKGLGELAVGVDLVVARPPSSEHTGSDLVTLSPEPPSVTTGPLPLDTPLVIQARKAQTGVTAPLAVPLLLPAGPEIAPDKTEVAASASTTIRIVASRKDEWYQLLLAGQPVGEEIKGNGQNRLLPTGELTGDTQFVLRITQRESALVVERFYRLPVIKVV